jgi:hypothetical protein
MLRKLVLATVFITVVCAASQAFAGGYTVYAHNLNWGDISDGQNWERSGFEHDTYKSFNACWNSVVDRLLENWQFGTNNEAFMIVWTDARPDWGCF